MIITKKSTLLEFQKGILFDCQVSDASAYTISATIKFNKLNEQWLEQSLQLVVHEQEALRSCIVMHEDVPMLETVSHLKVDVKYVNHEGALMNEEGVVDEQLMRELLSEPIELFQAPLFKFYVLTQSSQAALCFIKIHHMISDGWSVELFKDRLLHYYNKLAASESFDLTVNSGFLQYIELENRKLAQGSYQKQKQYWMEKLVGSEPVSIPPDKITYHEQLGVARELRFPIHIHDNVIEVAKELEVTPFVVYLSVFALLLKPYCQGDRVTFVTPFTHRPKLSMEQSIGSFVHMLPIVISKMDKVSFHEFVEIMQKEFIETYKHTGYPNNLIARDSKLVSMPGMPSIFDISFVHDVITTEYEQIQYIASNIVTFPGQMMVVIEQSESMQQLKIQYKANTFSEHTINLLGRRFNHLLTQCCSNIKLNIQELSYVLSDEQELILSSFNPGSTFSYKPQSIIDVFEERVRQHPDRRALLDINRELSYIEVKQKADQLAMQVLSMTNGHTSIVGVHMSRSIEMVISILAVLKAGCAYVPLDHSYPAKRKAYIVEDADISCMITDVDVVIDGYEALPAYTFTNIDQLANNLINDETAFPEPAPSSLAYIMYTSGSTGNPKGVMIEQHSVVNTLMALEQKFPMTEQSVFIFKTAYTFDVSATELFGWFMGEGALFVLEIDGEKNPHLIVDTIAAYSITHLNFVPTMFRLFLEVIEDRSKHAKLASLAYLFVGGEAITPELLHKYEQLEVSASLENVYGPTECSIWMSHYRLNEYSDQAHVPIGYPLHGFRWYVVGQHNELLPIGVVGELCISGAGLARGYVNLPQLTSEKFVQNPFYDEQSDAEYFKKMYRTGDLVRWLPNGTIEYIGRIDFQVKLHGIRLEAGEIESAISKFPNILQSVVIVKQMAQSSRLCAFYLSDNDVDESALKAHLIEYLPGYMIPDLYYHVQEIPKNSSGKADRNKLLALLETLKEESSLYTAPSSELEVMVSSIWEQVLQLKQPSIDKPFFELGGSSIGLISVHNKLQSTMMTPLPIGILFQYVTIRSLAAHLERMIIQSEAERNTKHKQPAKIETRGRRINREDIAIIGLSTRVPGANHHSEFWDNLVNGTESIHFYEDEELRGLGIPEHLISNPHYVKAKGRVDGIESFDHLFFDYTPSEVHMMSPQYRLMYKGVWDAFEDAGYDPTVSTSRIGLYLGGSDDFEWYRHMLLSDGVYSDQYQSFTLSSNHFLATRIAYKLNLRGPVYTALTGCSTSLVTPHLACQALQLGECDIAAAGGITVELPNEGGYLYEEGMMFSADGHCRPFDAAASGTMFSNGMGVIILKRLSDAMRDRDHIYGVIKGSAMNNDGNSKVGFLAPSVEGQVDVIKQAYYNADVDPSTISYVEAHGTGTLLGDPIEVMSLTQAFDIQDKQQCILGSVKGNVGHMDTAAGIIGLAKVALSLKHSYIPGTVNFETPNPKINFEQTAFSVKREGQAWRAHHTEHGVLRAGINSFGVGGTNAHMVLEQAPTISREKNEDESYHMILVSGKTETALQHNASRLGEFLLRHPQLRVEDVAWTLQVGRKHFQHRKAAVINNLWQQNGEQWLQLQDAPLRQALPESKKVVFMFPGQGSQYQGMARDLMNSVAKDGFAPRFRHHMERMLEMLPHQDRTDFIEIWFGAADAHDINQTKYSQLAIFMTSYSAAQSMIELGIIPDAMIGHSIGELVAATIAGVFSLEDAIAIVVKRGGLMQQQPAGVMLAVMSSAQQLQSLLQEGIQISLYNSSNACVVGGRKEQIEAFKTVLEDANIKFAEIKTSHAFHTSLMHEAAEQFEQFLSSMTFHPPQYQAVSNVTGEWITEHDWQSPAYWAKHIIEPVQFERNLEHVLKFDHAIYIEAGAGRTLSTFARSHRSKNEGHVFVSMLRHIHHIENDEKYVTARVAELWCYGVSIDFDAWYKESSCFRVSLPTYCYDEHHYPIPFNVPLAAQDGVASLAGCVPKVTPQKQGVSMTAATERIHEEWQRNGLELVLAAYRKLFGHEQITETSDFFELGGDSLKAVSLAGILQQMTGLKISMSTMFENVTPSSLSKVIQPLLSTDQHAVIVSETTPNENGRRLRSMSDAGSVSLGGQMRAYPASQAQLRMYTLSMLYPEDITWNLPSATIIYGKLDRARLEKALNAAVARHESLRTSFQHKNGQLLQVVHPSVTIAITYRDHAHQSVTVEELMRQFVKPFKLMNAPLLRAEIAQLGDEQHVLMFDVHHIVADGTSVELITNDINSFYVHQQLDEALPYRIYVEWLTENKQSASYQQAKHYWLTKLAGPRSELLLQSDDARFASLSNEGARSYFHLSDQMAAGLKEFAAQHQASMNMVLLTAWNVIIHHFSKQEDIIIGIASGGRYDSMFERTVGMFVNMLPLRNTVKSNLGLNHLLSQVKQSMLEALAHQQYQFDDMVHELGLTREANRNVLFDVCFDYQNMRTYELSIAGVTFESYVVDMKCASYDLLLTCYEQSETNAMSGFIEYRTALFNEVIIEGMVTLLQDVIQHMITNAGSSVASCLKTHTLASSSAAAASVISLFSRDTARTSNSAEPIYHNVKAHPLQVEQQITGDENSHQRLYLYFVEQLRGNPDVVAVIDHSGLELSYRQLAEQVDQCAELLRAHHCRAGSTIALMMGRSWRIHTTMLACLKLGVTFVLIDPALPDDRIHYMLMHSGVSLIVSDTYDMTNNVNLPVICVDELHQYWAYEAKGLSQDEAMSMINDNDKGSEYIAAHIYTSGSTGLPKGVQINELSLINFVEDCQARAIFMHASDRIYSVTTISFDIFMFESLVPLCLGKSIYVASEQEQLDASLAARKISEYSCTHLLSTVSRIKAFVEHANFAAALQQLRCILTGGEQVPASLLSYVHQHSSADLYNMYGPTETTIWSTVKKLEPQQEITIGQPIRNTKLYIVDDMLQQVPAGQVGELLISGAGVSSGYIRDPLKTAEQFIYVPQLSKQRLYRTGDRARITGNGDIQLMGRLDTQVKIRGYRVELAEIEEQLLSSGLVQYAIAVVRNAGTSFAQIIAVVTQDHDQKIEAISLEQQLKQRLQMLLPSYMLPAQIIVVSAMPTLPNGKLDRKHIQAMVNELESLDERKEQNVIYDDSQQQVAVADTKEAYQKHEEVNVPTRLDLQSRLLQLWKETLQRKDVGVDQNYFDLGGQSLGLITIHSELCQYLSNELLLIKLFEHPTIASFVQYAEEEGLILGKKQWNSNSYVDEEYSALHNDERNTARYEPYRTSRDSYMEQASRPSFYVNEQASAQYSAAGEKMTLTSKETVSNRRISNETTSNKTSSNETTNNVSISHVNTSRVNTRYKQTASSEGIAANHDDDIAVIGMACNFPGADNVHDYWSNLINGVDSIKTFSEEELLASGISADDIKSPHYVPRKGYLDGMECFDHEFFQYSLHEANTMDPQLRLLHQVTWHALEDGGYDPYRYSGKIGFFAGSGLSTPWLTRFIGEQRDLVQLFEAMTLNEKDYVTTRISYKLNLRGPSTNVQTACSTSLVAIHQAIQSLLQNEADMALAGGVSLSYPLKEGYMWHEGMIYSKDGYCRPFSSGATGTLSGNGCGIVLLKRLDRALQDGDQIYGVVKGSAINNDGRDKIGYTAPSVTGQKDVIQRALRIAKLHPEQIRYVEAHGTGTQLGDPIEVNALQQAWQSKERQYCAIGSVKANIGHLDAAAGVAGFIKAVCIARTRFAPPLLHYRGEHPQISLERTPFYVNEKAKPLSDHNEPIAVAVSSFGIGGTNAHVIITSPPVQEKKESISDVVILPMSAHSKETLLRNSEQLQQWLLKEPQPQLERVAWTLQSGRTLFQHRQAFVIEQGSTNERNSTYVMAPEHAKATQSLFMLRNMLPLYKGIMTQLYRGLVQTPLSAAFEQGMTTLLECLSRENRYDVRGIMREGTTRNKRSALLFSFIAQYSMFHALHSQQIVPDRYVGEGIGELVIWCLDNRLSPDEALKIISELDENSWDGLFPGALEYGYRNDHGLTLLPVSLRAVVQAIKGQAGYKQTIPALMFSAVEDIQKHANEQLSQWITAGITVAVELVEQNETLIHKWTEPDDLVSAPEIMPVFLLSEAVRSEEAWDENVMVMRALAQCWCYGVVINWAMFYDGTPTKLSLPPYSFERIAHEHDVKLDTLMGMKQLSSSKQVAASRLVEQIEEKKLSRVDITSKLKAGWYEQLGAIDISPSTDFFALGAQSLHVIALAAYLKRELNVSLSIEQLFTNAQFDQQEMLVWELYQPLMHAGNEKPDEFGSAENEQPETLYESGMVAHTSYEATSPQARVYVVQQMDEMATPYNLASFYKLRGALDIERFEHAISQMVARHEAFRTSFEMVGGKLYQHVHNQVPEVFELIHCTEAYFDELLVRDVLPFDLSSPSLLRVKLFQFEGDHFGLMIDMHHMISDQSSIAILLHEIAQLYDGESLPEPVHHYRHYAASQREWLTSEDYMKQKKFWMDRFASGPSNMELVTDYIREGAASQQAGKVRLELDEVLQQEIMRYCKSHAVTPFMVFIGTLHVLLWKYSGSHDVTIGTAIAGRRQKEWQSIIGMFVNMLPIRIEIDKELTFQQYMAHVKQQLLLSFDHGDFPYEDLVDELKLEKQSHGHSLFHHVMNYITMGTEELQFGGLQFEECERTHAQSKFDATWTIIDKQHRFELEVEFNSSLYLNTTIERMLERYIALLEAMITHHEEADEHTLAAISLWDSKDEQWLLDCNNTSTEYPEQATIPQLFLEIVSQFPEEMGLRWGIESYSYRELNNAINALAAMLQDSGISRGDRVGLFLSRGPMQVISIMAVLKLGSAYVPIDIEQPMERTAFMLQDSEASYVITEEQFAPMFSTLERQKVLTREDFDRRYDRAVVYEEPIVEQAEHTDEVYRVYTSGSTGTPKGVIVHHRNVIKVVRGSNFITIHEQDRMLQLSTYAFDGSVFDIFGSLLNGATLVLITKQQAIDIPALSSIIRSENISIMFITTALFNLLVDEDVKCMENMRCIMFGGEAASLPHVRKAVEAIGGHKLMNVYGPTETTFIATYHVLNEEPLSANSRIPIGKPLSNTTLYVLDEKGEHLPPNIVGELYIGGAGVSLGYANREELNNERFVHHSIDAGGRLYRTGDRVWRRNDGAIVYVERSDFQVKIRGYRIELGEIEARIRVIQGIKEVIVIAPSDQAGDTYLAGYYTCDSKHNLSEAEVYSILSGQLPDYMVPKRLMRLEHLPLSMTGKIDRAKLPAITDIVREHSITEAGNEIEQALLEAMKSVLDIPLLGIHDDFFQAGGQSLKVIGLVQQLRQKGLQLSVQDVFSYPTAAQLAKLPKLARLIKSPLSSRKDEQLEQQHFTDYDLSTRTQRESLIKPMLTMSHIQLQVTKSYIRHMNDILAENISGTSIIQSFQLSSMQQRHLVMGSSPSGFMTTITGNREPWQIKRSIMKLISSHQLLHSVLDRDKCCWHELDIDSISLGIEQVIPFYDLSVYKIDTDELLEEISGMLLQEPYHNAAFLWRIVIVRLAGGEYRIIWGFDHIMFDGMSAQVLIDGITSYSLDGATSHVARPIPFQSYVELMKRGPQHIDETNLISLFQLKSWGNAQRQWDKATRKIGQSSPVNLNFSVPLHNEELQLQWWTMLHRLVGALCSYTRVKQLPIAVLHYGREYGDAQFYQCVGEFLDVVPMTIGLETTSSQWFQCFELLKQHHVNFVTLLGDDEMASKYEGVQRHLQAITVADVPLPCLFFNFQGYIAAADRVQLNHTQHTQEHNDFLADVMITANFDETHLYFHVKSGFGFNTEQLMEYMTANNQSKQSIQFEVEGVKMTYGQ